MRRTARFLAAAAGALALMTLFAGEAGAVSWWADLMPHASTHGDKISFLYYLIYVITGITFVGVEALLVYFAIKYRARPDRPSATVYTHGSHKLEVIWTAIPAMILVFIAFAQRQTWLDIKNNFPESGEAVRIEGLAQRFNWSFRYPGPNGRFGDHDDVVSDKLVIPKDKPILIQFRSRDVIHSFFLPQMRVKQDVVPGLTIPVWFQATQTNVEYAMSHGKRLTDRTNKKGEVVKNERDEVVDPAFTYEIACAELCGSQHFSMRGVMEVVTEEQFEDWQVKQFSEMRKTRRGQRTGDEWREYIERLDPDTEKGKALKWGWEWQRVKTLKVTKEKKKGGR